MSFFKHTNDFIFLIFKIMSELFFLQPKLKICLQILSFSKEALFTLSLVVARRGVLCRWTLIRKVEMDTISVVSFIDESVWASACRHLRFPTTKSDRKFIKTEIVCTFRRNSLLRFERENEKGNNSPMYFLP